MPSPATTTADPDAARVGPRSPTPPNQPALRGNLAPVADERDDAACPVTGELPEGLRGSFVRNGPNPMFEPLGSYHMFDGDGMLHGVTFDEERRLLPQPLDPVAGPGRRGRPRRRGLPGAGRRDDLPRPVPHRRGRSGQEPGQHPHHPPRRAPPRPLGGRAAHRGDPVARHRRRVGLRRPPDRLDDRPPAPRPPHRRDAVLLLLAVRAVPPLPRGRRRPACWSTASRSTSRRR